MADGLAKKVLQFIEGNVKMLGDTFHILPRHEREQVLFRADICKEDCMARGYCTYCGCNVPGKLYVNASCNGGARFPDLMTAQKWEEYKKEHGIEVVGDEVKR
jgi:hypothetical protein